MLLILCLSLIQHAALGAALPTQTVDKYVSVSSEAPSRTGCDDLHHCRTIWSIIWSCVTTLILCNWVAIHPNIPGPNTGWFMAVALRMKLMVYALIAPELIVTWAARQWIAMRKLVKKYQSTHGWTQAHGFFVIMGGFMLHNRQGPVKPLASHELDERRFTEQTRNLTRHLSFQFPKITEEEIKDRSKSDALSKTLVIIQTSWFAIQCVARIIEHLPITGLELMTLAFVLLNLITYRLWWNKPLQVQCPFPVIGTPISDWLAPSYAGAVVGLNHNNIYRGGMEPRRKRQTPSTISRAVRRRFKTTTSSVISAFVTPLLELANMAGVRELDNDWTWTKKVPPFFAGDLSEDERKLSGYAAAGIAMLFGAIHCIAWSFSFPSHVEQLLWRISSITITCLPLYALAFYWHSPRLSGAYETLWGVLFLLLPACLYIIGRVALLVLAFMSLRSLPAGAYQSIRWVTLIPHI